MTVNARAELEQDLAHGVGLPRAIRNYAIDRCGEAGDSGVVRNCPSDDSQADVTEDQVAAGPTDLAELLDEMELSHGS